MPAWLRTLPVLEKTLLLGGLPTFAITIAVAMLLEKWPFARHPQPMLDPLPARFGCSGSPNMAQVMVTSTKNGKTTTFSAAPDCTWPGGVGAAVYFLAASKKPQWLALTEKRLRCEDEPALLVRPTPMLSVFACNHNLWTPRTAKLIRIAKNAPAIRSLDGSKLFPTQIGDRQCVIHGGGPAPGGVFDGVCEVTVKKVWSTPTVTLVESWSEAGRRWHAGERLVIKSEQVISARPRADVKTCAELCCLLYSGDGPDLLKTCSGGIECSQPSRPGRFLNKRACAL